MNYRVIHDQHGSRILRGNEPVSLEDLATELNAIGRELQAATNALNGLHRGLKALVKQAERSEV
jgi:hypothetical protein